MLGFRCFVSLLAGASSLVFAGDEVSPTLTPRQLYYNTSRPKVGAEAQRQAPAKKTTPTPKTDLSKPVTPTDQSSKSEVAPSRSATPPAMEATNLGLRYSIVDGNTGSEIDPAKVFHNGDIVRLKLQANSSGYLYVLNQGSSGKWQVLFPSAEVVNNNNRIEASQVREIPMGQNFEFYADPGLERLFVVLSREREPDMENLLNHLRSGQPDRPQGLDSRRLQAANRPPAAGMDVDGVRTKMTSRDIRVQTVRAGANGSDESAVYVVAGLPTTSRIVTDIPLKHE